MNRIWAALVLSALGVSSARASASARLTASPAAGQSFRAGATTTLGFAVEEDVEEMEMLLSLDGGRSFPVRVTRQMSEGAHRITWRVPNLPTTRARLALRVGSEEEGEVIRDVSPEFTILAAGTEPLEEIRPFRGEWRAGEALQEIPFASPVESPGLNESGESMRALRHETELDRTSVAAPAGGLADGHRENVQLPPPDRMPRRRASGPACRNLPKRE